MENKFLIYSLEDDIEISKIISLALSNQDYIVKCFNDYPSFQKAFLENKPDLILLDLMLPEISGEEILKQIRSDATNDQIQIIIVSAKNMVINKVDALNLGADDYISKPFDVLELISRVNVRIRRMQKNNIITIHHVSINFSKREVYVDQQNVKMTNSEFIILRLLFKKHGELVTREELFKELWGNESSFETRAIDVHVKEIRRKLGIYSNIIETIYGIGYRLKDE